MEKGSNNVGPYATKSFVELALQRALCEPERTAYTFLHGDSEERTELDYRQLHSLAARLAMRLAETASNGERVLLLLPSGIDYVVAFFACMYAGVIAVPIYPATSRRRIQRLHAVIDDSKPSVAITTEALLPRLTQGLGDLPSGRCLRWVTTDTQDVVASEHVFRPYVPADNDIAFLQYTSGSTGVPKGVMVSHGNLWHNSATIKDACCWSHDSITLSWLPPYHDMGLIGGVLQPMYSGCHGILMSPESFMQNPLRWLKAISDHRVTITGGPNFAYELCVRQIAAEQCSKLDLSCWRCAPNGAEPIMLATLDAFSAKFAQAGFRNNAFLPCYGLAESTLMVAAGPHTSGPRVLMADRERFLTGQVIAPPRSDGSSSISLVASGRPVGNSEIAIVGVENNLLRPPGAIGEICVCGPSVALGYWGKSDETDRVFGAAISGFENRRFLRTGDLGFILEGQLYISGRIKDMIIVRGRNIYPQDIEHAVGGCHHSLRPHACAAFPISTPDGEALAVAQELAHHDRTPPEEIFAAIRAAVVVEADIQPAKIVLLRAGQLPLTSSGKIQRSACRRHLEDGALDVIAVESREGEIIAVPVGIDALSADVLISAPSDVRRALLVDYLRMALAQRLLISPATVDIDVPLPQLGLDSLLAVGLACEITERFAIEIPFSKLLGDMTLSMLADDLDTLLMERSPALSVSSGREVRDSTPASAGQLGLWFLHRLAPESSAYNVVFAAKVVGDFDIASFEYALQAVVQRQDALRTAFEAQKSLLIQRLHQQRSAYITHVDATTWSESQLNLYLADEVHRPFNLERDVLFRVNVFTRPGGESILQFIVHHIIVDFWSLVVMMHEITEIYRARRAGDVANLPELKASYVDYVRWQEKLLDSWQIASARDFWHRQLSGPLPVLSLPTDMVRPAVQTDRGASVAFEISADITARLKALAQTKNVTLYNLLLSIYAVLMHRLSGQDELIIGTPTAGRKRREFADLVGYFVNSLPVRICVDAQASFSSFLANVRNVTLESFTHADYPFARIVSDILTERDPSRHPVFQTMFALQKAHLLDEAGIAPFVLGEKGARFASGGLVLESYPIDQRTCPFDLVLMMAEGGGKLLSSLQFNSDLFERSTVERFARYFVSLAEALLKEPETPLSRLSLCAPADFAMIEAWNRTAVKQPEVAVIDRLFEGHVRATPHAVAAEHRGERISYCQLNVRANQLANYLQDRGVKRGQAVAILSARSIDMLVATLATLKAGAVYVPLDPSYPKQRLQCILTDSNCVALLCAQQYIKLANDLHWENAELHTLVCLDAKDPDGCVEGNDIDVDRELWDYVAERASHDIDASGWMNSYTGEYFSIAEMDEYADNATAKLTPYLNATTRVLEVGCGSGLTMFKLAGRVSHYHGTDLSPAIIEKNGAIAEAKGLHNITLQALAANEISLVDSGPFDVIILNSVVQLFPGHNYLRQVLRDCSALLAPRGVIFVGDVMDLQRKPVLIESLVDYACNHATPGQRTKTDWERELFLDPDFFLDLRADFPEFVHVAVSNKIGSIDNELTRFRYDVVLEVDKTAHGVSKIARSRHQVGRRTIDLYPDDNLCGSQGPEDTAYVMYTSGSTGNPKGIAVPHRAVVRLVFNSDYADFQQSDRIGHLSNPAFDAATYEIWGALLNGACLCILDKEEVLSPATFATRIREERINALFLTSALFNQVAHQQPLAFNGLRYLLTGGEAMDVRAVHAVRSAGGPAQLANIYGPTEGTTFSTWFAINRLDDDRPVPIGRTIANTQVFIVDDDLQLVPVGVPGELCVAGLGLSHGYIGRPALTAEKFVPAAFGGASGMRMYRTGDRARWLPDGNIEFLGRIDHQVKIRGFRIELDEIEAELRRCPIVRDGVTLVCESELTGKLLIAYLVVNDVADPVNAVRHFLRRRLPDYMVPSHFVILDELPMTASGKIDRKALPPWEIERASTSEEFVAPRTEIERLLAAIWQEVLGLQKISIYDSFFELGGHSLLATQVASRIHAALHVEFPLRLMFEQPTIAALAARIEALRTAIDQRASPITPATHNADVPLSFAQQRLWFLSRLTPDSSVYNVPGGIWLTGKLDKLALRAALASIVERHETLRTRFVERDGEPLQQIQSHTELHWSEVDLRECGEGKFQQCIDKEIASEACMPFDLAQGPLLRCRLLVLGSRKHLLLITMHHIVCDGWSLGVFARELSSFYRSSLSGRPAELPPLPIRYADFAQWQRKLLAGGGLDEQLSYWRRQLADAPELLNLPTDRPHARGQKHIGRHYPVRINAPLVSALHTLANSQGVTVYMVLLAVFHLLLQRYSGQRDICIGTPVANRNRAELEPLIGFFVNTLVLRINASEAQSFADLLALASGTALDAYANQDLPFEYLVEVMRPTRDTSRSPLFQVMFALQNTPSHTLDLPELAAEVSSFETGTAKFDLSVSLHSEGDALVGYFQYDSDLFDAATIERMVNVYLQQLTFLCAHPESQLHDVPLLSESDAALIAHDWNETVREWPDGCMHQLFEAQAERLPSATAVIDGDETLTYGELDSRANQLAHHLRGLGVSRGKLVAVCMNRSASLVVTLTAILKAGAAYVPLDPDQPRERLGWMLSDAKPTVAIVDSDEHQALLSPGISVVCLAHDRPLIDQQPTHRCGAVAHTDDLAYVMYTSGSTGRPKGVMVAHRGLINRFRWQWRVHAYTSGDCFVQKSPYGFDTSAWEVFLPLANGARVVIAAPGGHRDPAYLRRLIDTQRITVIDFVPSMLQAFLGECPANTSSASSLKHIVLGGEALPPRLVNECRSQFEARLYNQYGPTEASIGVTAWICPEDPAEISIGRPIDNTQIYILDPQLNLVPIGVVGEIYIGGVSLARGYLNQPALTAERFIPDPFSGRSGQRLYRTGDLARFRADGNIDYLGRIDHQVKIHGVRIELGEIESALLAYPGVREAVVVAHGSDIEQRKLVAYVVAIPVPDLGELRRHLSLQLPDYMVPAYVVVLDELPLNTNGKVDRQLLPAPDESALNSAPYVGPRNETEAILAALWADVLGIERVGIHDNFFHVGGHSLLATRMVARVRDAFGIELPLRRLFEMPTIADLSAIVQELSATTTSKTLPTASPIPAVSRNQHRLRDGIRVQTQ